MTQSPLVRPRYAVEVKNPDGLWYDAGFPMAKEEACMVFAVKHVAEFNVSAQVVRIDSGGRTPVHQYLSKTDSAERDAERRAERLNDLVPRLSRELEMAQRQCKKWGELFMQGGADYAYQLSWSSSTFKNAALTAVLLQVLAGFEHLIAPDQGKTTEEAVTILAGELRKEILRNARSPSRSSSPVSNVLDEDKNSVRVEVLEILERTLES